MNHVTWGRIQKAPWRAVNHSRVCSYLFLPVPAGTDSSTRIWVDFLSLIVFVLVFPAGLLVGALDTVLDSNARVTPFRILLQVPGSQTSWVIASGELKLCSHWLDGSADPSALVCQELPWRR